MTTQILDTALQQCWGPCHWSSVKGIEPKMAGISIVEESVRPDSHMAPNSMPKRFILF